MGQARPDLWISFLSVVDIYKLNANVIVSIDHLFSPVPGAWVCFVFSQHFKVKPEKIKSWNHYWERSEHKYFIIWYFLCKIEFMHGEVKACVNTEISGYCVFILAKRVHTVMAGKSLANFLLNVQSLDNDRWKMEPLHFFVVFAPAVLHKLIRFTTSAGSIRVYTCWSC